LLSKNLKIKIYRIIILYVILNGCETWSPTLREERRLRKFENMVLRIFGPKRDGVTREWRKLLNDMYSSPNIVRVIKSSRILRIFGPKRDGVTREWRKLLNDMYSSPNIVRVIKSSRIRWAGHVVRMREKRGIYIGFWWRNLRERDRLGDPGIDGRIILRWIFWKWKVGVWTGRADSGQGQVAGTCECGNEPSGSIKCGEFHDQLKIG